ncbi:Peptidase S26A, signal peptidase I [Trema orientale]|uniref:Peptidase S26A, signal peptidase I n=1 Tax=Trema orientale TaxID=63057 RepID=A0A2P5BPT1_TREOI|nr:Peptidase S26A, signal peptidase I [Trema orientale]
MALRNGVREILSIIKEKSLVREAWDKIFPLAKFACGLHVIHKYLGLIVLTYGPSMLPTLSLTGDLVLAERISTRFGLVGPGDIVVVRSPQNPRIVVTKRLIGLEGDSVTYVVEPGKSDRSDTIVVPKGHIWVEGDNIYVSNDSRKFGPVPYGLLQGKIFWRIWPPKDFGSLRRSSTKDPILDKGLPSA